jgi:hypothetical protein
METFADEAATKPQRQGGSERSNPFESISRLTGLLRAEVGRMRLWEVLPDGICSAFKFLVATKYILKNFYIGYLGSVT